MVYKVGFLEKIFGEKLPKVVTEYYEAGYKKAEGTVIWKQSRSIYTKDGLWTYWYHNGKKEKEVTYKNEMIDGLWTSWYKNGRKKEERTYKIGKRDGKSVTYWSKTGKKREEGTYKNGKKDGFWIYRYENGRKKEKIFFNESKKIIRRSKLKKIKPRSKREFGDIKNIKVAMNVPTLHLPYGPIEIEVGTTIYLQCPYCWEFTNFKVSPYNKIINDCEKCSNTFYSWVRENNGYEIMTIHTEHIDWENAYQIVKNTDYSDFVELRNAQGSGDYSLVSRIAKKYGILNEWEKVAKMYGIG